MLNRNRIIAGLCVLFLAAALTGCGTKQETPETEPVRQTESVPQTEAETEATLPEVLPYVVVSTEYGALRYQDQWSEFIKTEQNMENGTLTVRFEAEINGSRYSLFDIVIGEGGDSPAGEITDASGVKRNVYVVMKELVPGSDLTESECNRLYAMQEDINYILENLE